MGPTYIILHMMAKTS